jgi:phosphatidylserine/phosphatidylglycerophosphate/cardiolipin synthase-like enzyme
MNKTCGICGISISDKVANYSSENYNMLMCWNCQERHRNQGEYHEYEFDNCRVYIGTGVGEDLLVDIKNAKKSIDVVSPYTSNDLIDELINLAHRGVKVRLFTNNDIGYIKNKQYPSSEKHQKSKQDHDDNLRKIICQKKNVNEEVEKKRNKDKKEKEKLKRRMSQLNTIMSIINIFLILSVCSVPYICLLLHNYWLLLLIIFIMGLWKISSYLKDKNKDKIKKIEYEIENAIVYTYEYLNKLDSFSFFVFKEYNSNDENENNITVHSKIYIIDHEVAYLGSLNFTTSGTVFNHEAVVRIADNKSMRHIVNELDKLINNGNYKQIGCEYFGKQIYPEPIN